MVMDRESTIRPEKMDATDPTKSDNISSARYAWGAIQFPMNFVACDVSFEWHNSITDAFVPCMDASGNPLDAIPATPGAVIPINPWVNYNRQFRLAFSVAQSPDMKFVVICKT